MKLLALLLLLFKELWCPVGKKKSPPRRCFKDGRILLRNGAVLWGRCLFVCSCGERSFVSMSVQLNFTRI